MPARGGHVARVPDLDNDRLAEQLLDLLLGLHKLMRGGPPPGGVDAPEPGGRGFPEAKGQFRLMRVLVQRGRLPMQELAAHLDVAPPTATGIVKRLLEQGYVERGHDDADWRAVWVELTPAGREAITRHHQERVAALRGRIERLSPEERAQLGGAIPALAALLRVGDASDLSPGQRGAPPQRGRQPAPAAVASGEGA